MAIAAGEYGYDPGYFRRMLDARAVDVLQADVTRACGITGLQTVAALSIAYEVPFSAHCAPQIHAHAGCAIGPLRHCEYFHTHERAERILFDGVLEPVHGTLRPDPSGRASASSSRAPMRSATGCETRRPRRADRHPALPHVLREYALLADGERGVARRAAGRLRVDVLSPLGLGRVLLVAHRRRGRLRGHAAGTATCGAATTSTEPDLAQPLGHRRRRPIECREALALPATPRPGGDPAPCRSRAGHRAGRRRAQPARGTSVPSAPPQPAPREDGAWTSASSATRTSCWTGGSRRRAARRRASAAKPLTLSLELEQGESHDLILVLAGEASERAGAGSRRGVDGDRVRMARANPRAPVHGCSARRATRLRGALGPDQRAAAGWSRPRPRRCPSAPAGA